MKKTTFTQRFISTHDLFHASFSLQNDVGFSTYFDVTLFPMHDLTLTISTGKNCVLLNLIQKFIKIEAWLLLTFLHKQLSSIRSIVTT